MGSGDRGIMINQETVSNLEKFLCFYFETNAVPYKNGNLDHLFHRLCHHYGIGSQGGHPLEWTVMVVTLWKNGNSDSKEAFISCIQEAHCNNQRVKHLKFSREARAKVLTDHRLKAYQSGYYKGLDRKFYSTKAWKHVRYAALEKYGNFCSCCGRGPAQGVILHVDHIRPRSVYPDLALNIDNLQILCADCNMGKLHLFATNWVKHNASDSKNNAEAK